MTTALDLIARIQAKPKTHAVVTTYGNGKVKRFETQSLAQAENFAVGENRKIGRPLIDRETDETVTVVSVEIVEL